jgi:signal transduction histidine kinase
VSWSPPSWRPFRIATTEHPLDLLAPCPLAGALAQRMRDSRDALTERWLARIANRVNIHPNRVFPSDELLNHVPLLMLGVADYLEFPTRVIAADVPVMAKAMELGALRHSQGFDVHELLKEYEILGGILFAFLTEIVDEIDQECTRSELLVCAHRVFQSVALIQQATMMQFLQLTTERLVERDERLRAFNRALTHEFRNRIGAVMGAGQLLESLDADAADRQRLAGVVVRNMDGMRMVLENLLELSRVDTDARQQRHVRLPQAAAEVARQLRDAARAAGVVMRLSPTLPDVEVSAAAVELCLTNLVSNAIKYADPARAERWVEVSGETVGVPGAAEVVVRVRDNGLGVPEEQRASLFTRFFRAHEHSARHVEGTGLGLSIVRETIRSLGGRVWAEFPADGGALFAFALPSRRATDPDAPLR